MNNRKRTALCLLGAALCVFMAFGAALALGRYPITPAALLAGDAMAVRTFTVLRLARARFAAEAVSAVHAAVPGMPIDYKLAVRQEDPHYGNAGVLESELGIFVPLLTDAGVTSFHVTLANHSSLEDTIPPANHPYFKEQGCFLKFCDEVRQYTDKPITGVGGLNQPDFVEQQLASGRITCAAMSRQLLADPEWPNKVASGQIKEIHRCVRCNKKCLGGLQQHQGTHCIYEKV